MFLIVLQNNQQLVDGVVIGEEVQDHHHVPRNEDGSTRKRRRTLYERTTRPVLRATNPWQVNPWLKMIRDPNVNIPSHRRGKEFRRKFRVPFPVFQQIVTMCIETEDAEFNRREKMATGEWAIPIELKILSVLRCLGSGMKFYDLSEMTGHLISEQECGRFFKCFMKKFRIYFERDIIKPLEGEALVQSMREYAMLGLPGCIGSIDCTFVPWERVSINLKNLYDGDKGQGVLFEVIVTHFKKVISVGNSIPGTINDKTSVKYSSFVQRLRSKEIYNNISYRIYTSMDIEDSIELSTVYLICDGGYMEWEVLMTGYGESGDPVKYKFTDWIASVRKDVECFYGILKARFRFLKTPVTLQSRTDVENVFIVCCMIHNLVLEADGLDTLWESDVNWKHVHPDDGEEEEEEVVVQEENNPDYDVVLHNPAEDFVPTYVHDLIPVENLRIYQEESMNYSTLQNLLANNLQYTYRLGKLRWPKTRTEIAGDAHNMLPRVGFPMAGDLQ